MTKRLILTRHAKSDWAAGITSDHARPLNPRGRANASAIGAWLEANAYQPDVLLYSDAVRTTETAERIMRCLSKKPIAAGFSSLYHAGPTELFQLLSERSETCVMIIGHNPTMGITAARLSRNGATHPRFLDYPTGATTILEFNIESWEEIAPQSGAILDFKVPREL